jgi:type IV pilus assembly protein PilB
MPTQKRRRLGDILVEMGFISRDQLEMAAQEAKKTGALLGEVLQRLDWVTDEDLQSAIAVQSGAKVLDTDAVEVDFDLISRVPHSFVSHFEIFPFSLKDGILHAATANPFDVLARDKLARLTEAKVETFVAPKEWVLNAIDLYYKTAATIDSDVEDITQVGGSGVVVGENQIVRLADLLIEKGYLLQASDIHIVPDHHLVRVFYRIDGVLYQQYLFPIRFFQALSSRLKVMAEIDISNPNIPHDGRISYKGSVGAFELRVSTFPTHLGETIVLRLLVYSSVVGDLKNLGFEEREFNLFMKTIHRPYGLILATGPTGSGKTTTLYSALMDVNNPSVSVMTIEDPIEFEIPTLRQSAVAPKAGLNFGNAIRAAMRQDPDVILVGEIRDQETAELALRASITGHLVLSTLHTNDAASTVSRLLDLGVSPTMLASALTMVVAQRFLRRAGAHCADERSVSSEEMQLFARYSIDPPERVPVATGCKNCHGSGYRGRAGIYEIMIIDKVVEELIVTSALRSKIEEAMVSNGSSLLFQQALKKVRRGVTSMEEVYRVVAYA